MFDDEDYDDYFLADDAEEDRRDRRDEETRPTADGSRRTIEFVADRRGGDGSDRQDDTLQPDDRHRQRGDGCLGFLLRPKVGCFVVLVAIVVSLIGYFRYFSPTVDDAVMEVYVAHIERRGIFFKTYEAEVVEPAALADSSMSYMRSRSVTIESADLARRLRQMQSDRRPVTVGYRAYSATLPWRGESKIVVTDIRQ